MPEIIVPKQKRFRFRLPDKYDLNQYCRNVKSFWYRIRYRIKIGYDGTLLPTLGRGKFVDVIKKGSFIDIINHSSDTTNGTIRLIPYQCNHGVMVEYITPKGEVSWRVHCSYDDFFKMGFSMQERKE